jgi:hypothetical protein
VTEKVLCSGAVQSANSSAPFRSLPPWSLRQLGEPRRGERERFCTWFVSPPWRGRYYVPPKRS